MATFKKAMDEHGVRVKELSKASKVGEKTISKLRNKPKHGVSDVSVSKCLNAFNAITNQNFSREDLDI